MKRTFWMVLFLLVAINLWGQKNTPFELPKKLTAEGYQAGRIVLKLKSPESTNTANSLSKRSSTIGTTPGITAIDKELGLLKASGVKKVFAEEDNPKLRKSPKIVDLSNIYFINIPPEQDLVEAINILLSNSQVEYAEPYYNHKLFLEPNDPNSKRNSGTQYQLNLIKAYEAWDIQRGDTNMVIGIIDTGVLPTHQDLFENIKINYADPINGIDDDYDGYVDNIRGWDFANFDNNPLADFNGHGTEVAGCSNGRANNGVGVAGTSYNSKFLPLKIFHSGTGLFGGGFEAIKYASDKGCKVINLSWGNDGGYSKYEQDVINYAVLQRDVVVVAAAGNTNAELKFYPSSYENVLSVGATNSADQKAGFSTFNHLVDICAPGEAVGTTGNTGIASYVGSHGTSFSSPIVAGAASLVRLKFPSMNALQVCEQLRVTADDIFNMPANVAYKEKLGKGRLNMYRALTDTTSPSVRVSSFKYNNGSGSYAFYGDTIKLSCEFKNYLTATKNLKISLTSTSPYVTIVNGSYSIGKLSKLQAKNNDNSPFEFYLSSSTPDSQKIVLRVGFEDGLYQDYQYIEFITSPEYIDAKYNSITLTSTSVGRLGYNDDSKNNGVGLLSDGEQLLGSGGIIFATSPTKVSNNVITNLTTGATDKSLTATKNIKFFRGSQANLETRGTFVDSIGNANKIGLVVTHKVYGWANTPDNNFVVLDYFVTNKSGATIPSLYSGVFADWNIDNKEQNKADWDAVNNFGYITSSKEGGKMVAIGTLTSGTSIYYAMDNAADNGNGIQLKDADGFSKSEKWSTLSNGIGKKQSGVAGSGGDVSHVVGLKIDNIENKKSVRVAFAIVVGNSLEELRAGIERAKLKFSEYQQNPPTVMTVKFCNNTSVSIERPDNKSFKLYNNLPATTAFYSGKNYNTALLTDNKTIYVTDEDEGFEGEPGKLLLVRNDAVADFAMDIDTLDLVKNNRVTFTDLTKDAVKWSWDFDNGYKSSNKSSVKVFSKQGTYKISLIAENSTGCKDTISKNLTVISSSPKPIVPPINICKGGSVTVEPINGTNFNFYESFPLTVPSHIGSSFYFENLATSKTLWITNTDSLGESEPLEYTLKVWDKFADFKFGSDTLNLDVSTTVRASDQGKSSLSWKWIAGRAVVENKREVEFTFHKSGIYPISLIVVNSTGCEDTLTKSLVVVRKSPKPVSKVYDICKNSSVEIAFNNGRYRFYKKFPNIPVYEGNSYVTGPLAEDLIFYVTNLDSVIESEVAEMVIKVKSLNATVTMSGDTLRLNDSNNIKLSAQVDSTIRNIEWIVNGEKDSALQSTFYFYEEGVYPIQLVINNDIGCSDTIKKELVVVKSDYKLDQLVYLYPNPTTRFVNLDSKIPAKDLLKIELLSSQGKVIKVFRNLNQVAGVVTIDTGGCNSGLYFLRIETIKGTVLRSVMLVSE